MKFGVVVFPGSNCDQDIFDVLSQTLGMPTVKLWHKDTSLQNCDFIVLPGGFSYGDYLRSGAIARFSPIMDQVIAHAESGKYLMGICNGFQILTEAELVPGTLQRNDHRQFHCKNVFIKAENNQTLLTRNLSLEKAYKIPIAHAEGRYYAPQETLAKMVENNQILFKYCDQNAQVNAQSNPNGSLDNIAGVTNKRKNVFGMMPHPERAASQILGNTDGLALFQSIIDTVLA